MGAKSTASRAPSEMASIPLNNWKGDLRSIGFGLFQRYAPKKEKRVEKRDTRRAGSTEFLQSNAFPCRVTFLIAPSASERGREMSGGDGASPDFRGLQLSGILPSGTRTQYGLPVGAFPSRTSLSFGELCFSSLQLLGQTTFPFVFVSVCECFPCGGGGNQERLPLRFLERISNISFSRS